MSGHHRKFRPLTQVQLERKVNQFNENCPPGTEVFYHPVIGDLESRRTRVRAKAYVLSGHTAVCFVEGVSGCVALDALEVA